MTHFLIKLFVRDYQRTSDPRVREAYGVFAGGVGIASNILLFLIKITVGLLFNSVAITADAINNLSDSGSSLVALFGFKLSGKPADAKHPYGHARIEYISGLIVSFVILILGVQLIQSGFAKILHPQQAQLNLITVFALVTSILIKLWQHFFYRKVGSLIKSTTLTATAIDSRNDVLATSAVLFAAVITHFTGFDLDGYMGILVALFILATGVSLVRETSSPLLGLAPKKELVDMIYNKILSYEGVIGLHDLRVHSYGVGKYFATVHCEVSAKEDIMVSHDLIDNIERDFKHELNIDLVIHLDPIDIDDERTNELRARVGALIKKISPKLGMHDFRVVWGVTHSNLIFDVEAPFEFELKDDQLTALIQEKIYEIDPTYHAVITIDHDYIPRYVEDHSE